MKRKKKIRLKKKIVMIILIISIITFIYSLTNIVIWYFNNKNNKELQEDTNQYVIINDKPNEDENDNNDEYTIDWQSLKEKNKNTVAYLKVNNTKIDYVIVKGKDNSYYLKHSLNNKYNRSGWPFADYHNKFDGNDKNIIIYGHNTKDGSMFGSLKNILKKDWYTNRDNLLIDLYTEKEILSYQVFSVYTIKAEDYYIQTDFSNTNYNDFIKKIKKRSIYNFNIDTSDTTQILTLSTCTGSGTSRVVLHAKLVNRQNQELS